MNARVLPNTLPAEATNFDVGTGLDLSALSAHIAAELAAGLSEPADIRKRYSFTIEQWETLKKTPYFRKMLGEAVLALRGDLNAGNRITKKAEIVLEDAIPAYDTLIHSKEAPAQAKIDAGKLLAQLAGRTGKDGAVAPAGSGFTLNINLHGREKLVIDGKALPVSQDE